LHVEAGFVGPVLRPLLIPRAALLPVLCRILIAAARQSPRRIKRIRTGHLDRIRIRQLHRLPAAALLPDTLARSNPLRGVGAGDGLGHRRWNAETAHTGNIGPLPTSPSGSRTSPNRCRGIEAATGLLFSLTMPFSTENHPNHQPPATLRPVQIVVGMLAFGCLAFSAFAAFQHLTGRVQPQPGPAQPMPLIWAVTGMGELVAWVVLRQGLLKQTRRTWETSSHDEAAVRRLVVAFTMFVIIRAALIEGWSLLGAMTFLISGIWSILAGPALGVFLLLITWPTETALRGFLSKATGGEVR
jgi:hypothetical protein